MGTWNELSTEISQAIQSVGKNIVTVQAGGGRTSSGIILEDDTIVASAHAVSEGESVRVWISHDKPHTATLVGRDSGTEIAHPVTGRTMKQAAGPMNFVSKKEPKPLTRLEEARQSLEMIAQQWDHALMQLKRAVE